MKAVDLQEGVQFFPESPRLDLAAMHDEYTDWVYGQKVLSGLVVVGFIETTPELQALLASEALTNHSYELMYPEDPLYNHPAVKDRRQKFDHVVTYDKARSGVIAPGKTRLFAGYSNWPGERWHSDGQEIVRWLDSSGQSSTDGLNGCLTKSDYYQHKIGELIRSGTLTRQPERPGGYVMRITVASIHSRPRGNSSRLFQHNTTEGSDLY